MFVGLSPSSCHQIDEEEKQKVFTRQEKRENGEVLGGSSPSVSRGGVHLIWYVKLLVWGEHDGQHRFVTASRNATSLLVGNKVTDAQLVTATTLRDYTVQVKVQSMKQGLLSVQNQQCTNICVLDAGVLNLLNL